MSWKTGLKRVVEVYALLEQTRSAELSAASGAVLEVEQAKGLEAAMRAQQAAVGRAALILGDRAEWALAEAQQEASDVRSSRLEQVRIVRDVQREDALAAYRRSKLELQQVESTLERQRRHAKLEAERRAQAAADDRYLARREWLRGQVDDEDPDRA